MPVLRKYRDKNGHYILTSINKTMVTFQLTPKDLSITGKIRETLAIGEADYLSAI